MLDTAVVDVDGTLVDSSYHHLIAWARAFDAVGLIIPSWRLHRYMGMGGDKLVAAAAGQSAEQAVGDEVRARWRKEYDDLLREVRPFPGALELLQTFDQYGVAVVLATSGEEDHVNRSLELLDISPGDFAVVNSADVDETKPARDLVEAAVSKVGGNAAVMIGDTVWDVEAGERAGVPVIGVLTGGVSAGGLCGAGAVRIYEDVAAISADLAELIDDPELHSVR